jgi:tetratricopeptide (TPR) repeat protein
MTDRWERLTDLYHAAVALSADERAALLTEECADDPALMADVERLVAAHDRARGSDETPGGAAGSEATRSPTTDGRLGPYRILKEIGRSQKGPVYLAERDDGRFEQRVAITVLEGETDANAALERLRSVHQILSSRDHPMLARLIDGGTAENGAAYGVMEYVEGEPIDQYADSRRLSITERLQLFIQVCNAVGHAHRRRVVHGSLTPTSIFVTAGGVPKLLDYGMVAHNDTPAADVYALGVVLDTLMGGGSSNGERRRLREDLDAIVVRALRKEANRRYDSVEHLADDIRRHLDSPAARVRPEAARPQRSAKPRRALSPIFAWSLAAAAVLLLGVQVAALRPSREALAPVAPTPDAPAPRPRITVADFADHVDDALLASAVSDAFRVGLTESPFVQVVSTRQSRVKAIVTVSVDTVNGRYAFTAQLSNPKGETLAGLTETATDSTDVLTALGRLAERVRRQMGEGLATLSLTPRLDEVMTASLTALRSYANAGRVINGGDRAGGIRLLKAAVAIDTGFASAHRLLALTYRDMGDRARYAESVDHAIANQTRLPFFERYHFVGSHALTVLGDYATAIDAYRRLLERYPDDVRGLANLALAHAARREYAVQDSLLMRAIAVDSSVPSLYASLALAKVNRGNYDDARKVLDRIERRFPGLRSTQVTTIALAASAQDWEAAEREARRRVTPAPDDTADALDGLETLAGIAMTQGRLKEAEQSFRRILTLGTKGGGGSARRYLSAARRIAYLELRYHHSPSVAVTTMDAALARVPLDRMDESDRPYDEIARLFADAGQPRRARDLMSQAARTRVGRQRGIDPNRRWTLGAIAMAEGQPWQGEIEILQAAEAHTCPICALPDLARAYEVAGKPDSAIATYERYLQTPWQSRVETDEAGLGFALRRLGELYQQQNDRARAAAQYSMLLKLWKNADAELDPLLADVRRRLEQTSR